MAVMKYTGSDGIFRFPDYYNDECLRHYNDNGWILLKGFFDYDNDILVVHKEVNILISLKLDELKLSQLCNSGQKTIHTRDFLQICKHNREKAGEIYRATRHLCGIHAMLMKVESIHLAKTLMMTDAVNVIPYAPIRIDIKGEEKYLFDWHQDYPYIQGSIDGIVVWTPMFDVVDGAGGIKLIPGSHKHGLREVILCDPYNAEKNGAHTVKIAEAEKFDEQDSYMLDVEAGDALVFNTLLLHKSIEMVHSDVRWTTQLRYANYRNIDAVKRGWPGGMIEGNGFEQDHAEYVIK